MASLTLAHQAVMPWQACLDNHNLASMPQAQMMMLEMMNTATATLRALGDIGKRSDSPDDILPGASAIRQVHFARLLTACWTLSPVCWVLDQIANPCVMCGA